MPQDAQIPFEGVLNCWNDEHDLPDLLLFIGGSAKTGILQFSNPEGDKTVHFKNGKIVFAESSSQDGRSRTISAAHRQDFSNGLHASREENTARQKVREDPRRR